MYSINWSRWCFLVCELGGRQIFIWKWENQKQLHTFIYLEKEKQKTELLIDDKKHKTTKWTFYLLFSSCDYKWKLLSEKHVQWRSSVLRSKTTGLLLVLENVSRLVQKASSALKSLSSRIWRSPVAFNLSTEWIQWPGWSRAFTDIRPGGCKWCRL